MVPGLLIHREGSPGGGAGAGDWRRTQADEPKRQDAAMS